MDKFRVRGDMTTLRSQMTYASVELYSSAIAANLFRAIDFAKHQRLHIYDSNATRHEVSTMQLINELCRRYPTLHVVRGSDSRHAAMEMGQFDIIIVPLVAFDPMLNRLGLGAGWYDRFLESQPSALTVGLAYDIQQVARVPVESFDIPLDMVITQTRILTNKKAPH